MTHITTEERERVYHILARNKTITTALLRNAGFSEKRIHSLVRENFINRVKIGKYELWSIGSLYLYCLDRMALGDIDEALAGFEYYYLKNPTAPTANLAMFMRCVLRRDYVDVENYLDGFIRPAEDAAQNADYNFYLYMLAFIIDLPDKYKERVRKMSYSDIDSKNQKNSDLSPVRIAVYYSQNFTSAYDYLDRKDDKSNRAIIIRHLLLQALERQNNLTERMRVLLRERNVKAIKQLLDAEAARHELKVTLRGFRSLADDILWMKRTGIPIAADTEDTDEFFRLIQLKNYDRALENNAHFMKFSKKYRLHNDLGILLTEAIAVRDRLLARSKTKRMHRPKAPLPILTPISSMISSLTIGNIEEGLAYLAVVIDLKGLQEYDYILKGTVDICLNEKDTAFIAPLIALSELSRGTFSFDLDEYLTKFDYFIKNNDLASAQVCIDIMAIARERGHIPLPNEEILRTLKTLRKRLNKRNELVTKKMIKRQKKSQNN